MMLKKGTWPVINLFFSHSVILIFILCIHNRTQHWVSLIPHLHLTFIFKFLFCSFASLDIKPSNQRNRVRQLDQSVNENSCRSEQEGGGSGDRHSCLTVAYNRQATRSVYVCVLEGWGILTSPSLSSWAVVNRCKALCMYVCVRVCELLLFQSGWLCIINSEMPGWSCGRQLV